MYFIVLEYEVAAAKPGGCDGDEDLVTDKVWTGCLRFKDATRFGAFEDCESDIFGLHDWRFEC